MRKSLMTAAAAIALMAGPALAQAPGSATPRPAPASPSAQTTAPRTHKMDPLKQEDLSQVKGTDVYGADDKKIGSIDTVLMKPESKTIDRLVVKSGGVLGVGGRDVAIPVDQFSWDSNHDAFKLSKTEDQLKSMAEWKAPSSTTSSTYGSSGPATPTGTGVPTSPSTNTPNSTVPR